MLLLLQERLQPQVPGGRKRVVGMCYYTHTLLLFHSQDFCSLPLQIWAGLLVWLSMAIPHVRAQEHCSRANTLRWVFGSSLTQPHRFINLALAVVVPKELVPQVPKTTSTSGAGQLQSMWELQIHTQPVNQIQINHCNHQATAFLPSLITTRPFILVLQILSSKVGKRDFSLFSHNKKTQTFTPSSMQS